MSRTDIPWAWTDFEDAEYWRPAGSSKADAIKAARGKHSGVFFIAPCRRASKREREDLECDWMVDSTKTQRIKP